MLMEVVLKYFDLLKNRERKKEKLVTGRMKLNKGNVLT